jgi:hypothetical protein
MNLLYLTLEATYAVLKVNFMHIFKRYYTESRKGCEEEVSAA